MSLYSHKHSKHFEICPVTSNQIDTSHSIVIKDKHKDKYKHKRKQLNLTKEAAHPPGLVPSTPVKSKAAIQGYSFTFKKSITSTTNKNINQ